MKTKAILLLLGLLIDVHTIQASSWSYSGEDGKSKWPVLFKTCEGTRQSPINLDSSIAHTDNTFTPFSFVNFDSTTGITLALSNNGHAAQVTYTAGDVRVGGGGLGAEYQVLQFHFHWGLADTRGSEHTLDGQAYPMEMHVVAWNKKYPNFGNAVQHTDGLAVLGLFFQIAQHDNPHLATIVNALPSVKEPGSVVPLPPFALGALLQQTATDDFFRYQGSLTTPTCNEVVTWTVFRKPVGISAKQLSAFRSLLSSEHDEATGEALPMGDNFRAPQPLDGRELKISV